MTSLRNHKDKITELVNEAIQETFRLYFQMEVNIEKVFSFYPIKNAVTCRTKISDDSITAAVFISIEQHMLNDLAGKIYAPELARKQEACESCAMEITNIVCSRIKTYFNDNGYNFGMHLPEIVGEGERQACELELLFSVSEDKLVVDIGLLEKNQSASV